MTDMPECAVCCEPIDEFDWCVEVRMEFRSKTGLAHHTCPPERRDA